MKFTFVDFFCFIFIALYFYKSKMFVRSEFNTDYLSKNSTTSRRAALSLLVIIHHLSYLDVDSVFIKYFAAPYGHFFVAMFFFFSGYGLTSSFNKNKLYKHNFLLKRLPRIIIPFAIATACYFFIMAIFGNSLPFVNTFLGMFNFKTVVPHSWYITASFYLYIGFCLSMHLSKNNKSLIIINALVVTLYFMYCFISHQQTWWYSSVSTFLLGIVWASYEREILSLIKKKYFFSLTCFFVLLFVTYNISIIKNLNIYLLALFSNISCIFFCVFVNTIMLKIQIHNKILFSIGKRSLEIYLIQGFLQFFLRGSNVYITSDVVYFVVVLFGCILFGYLYHLVDEMIIKSFYKLLKL